MGATLTIANEKSAYTLSDDGTWFARETTLPYLRLLYNRTDAVLRNQYSVIPVNPAAHPGVFVDKALVFARWLVSAENPLTARVQERAEGHRPSRIQIRVAGEETEGPGGIGDGGDRAALPVAGSAHGPAAVPRLLARTGAQWWETMASRTVACGQEWHA